MVNSLDDVVSLLKQQPGKPPLHLWDPEYSGDMDLIIKSDGSWWHESSPINKHALVKLFASILRCEVDSCHYLVTPVEKWRIKVEDKPLLVTAMDLVREGDLSAIYVTTNVESSYVLGEKYPLKFDRVGDESRPYVMLDHGVEARIVRSVYYRLMDLVVEHDNRYYIESQGVRFEVN